MISMINILQKIKPIIWGGLRSPHIIGAINIERGFTSLNITLGFTHIFLNITLNTN